MTALRWLLSPLYRAVIECVPTDKTLVPYEEHWENTLLFVASAMAPSTNVTEPLVGTGNPQAVKVTVCPDNDGFGLDVSEMAALEGTTT